MCVILESPYWNGQVIDNSEKNGITSTRNNHPLDSDPNILRNSRQSLNNIYIRKCKKLSLTEHKKGVKTRLKKIAFGKNAFKFCTESGANTMIARVNDTELG